MNLPKVEFCDISLLSEVDLMYDFLFLNQWGWKKYIIKKHRKLNKIFLFKTKTDQMKFLKKYVINFRKENEDIIEKNKITINKAWKKIEKKYLNILSEVIEIDWPKDRKTIKAMFSINPICPRFLDDWSFSLFYNYKITHTLEVITHEISHLLYFEKWKQMYPKMSHKKFDSPYVEWHLSEIITPIILNDSKIQSLINEKAVFYEEHQKLKINGKNVPEYFTDLYLKNKKEKKDFREFVEKAYDVMKNNKKIFQF
jgi:hypothetical protein